MERDSAQRRVLPHVAPGARPDRAEVAQQGAQDVAGLDGFGLRQQVEQPARPRAGQAAADLAEAAEQRGAALETGQRVVRGHLEAARQLLGRQRRQPVVVGAQRLVVARGERAGGEHLEARHAQPLGAREHRAVRGPVAPRHPRAGVNQHGGDGEIELGPSPLARVWNGRGQRLPAPAEVPPPRVERHVERGVALADQRGDAGGERRQKLFAQRKAGAAGARQVQRALRRRAHRLRRQRVVFGGDAHTPSSGLPTVARNTASSGTVSEK